MHISTFPQTKRYSFRFKSILQLGQIPVGGVELAYSMIILRPFPVDVVLQL